MTKLEPMLVLNPSDRVRDLCGAIAAGALIASCAWIWLYMADTASWGAQLATEQGNTQSALIALVDRCPVPQDGQIVGYRKAGKPVCLPVDNLALPKLPK